jgi:hypothetical protein
VSTHREWNPEEIKQALDMELNPYLDENGNTVKRSSEAYAAKRLKENAAFATEVLIDAMQYGDDSLRVKAATEILNRVFGKVTDQPMSSGTKDSALGKFLDGVVTANHLN